MVLFFVVLVVIYIIVNVEKVFMLNFGLWLDNILVMFMLLVNVGFFYEIFLKEVLVCFVKDVG